MRTGKNGRRYMMAAVGFLTGLGIAISCTGASAYEPATEKYSDSFLKLQEEVTKAQADSWQKKPGDYLALNDAVIAAGGNPITVTFPKAGLENLTAAQAQREVDTQEALHQQAQPGHPIGILSVPLDAFDVSHTGMAGCGGLADECGSVITGLWNFRDNYVNGSDPDDISALALEYDTNCVEQTPDSVTVSDYAGQDYSHKAYRQSSSSTSNVWGINDDTTGFKLNSDHGSHSLALVWHRDTCGTPPIRASYHFEHNQDGNGGWSASVGLGSLSVSYTGNGGNILQKGTQIARAN